MQPHQQRVVTERDELHDKVEKLAKFVDTDTYAMLADAEKDRLLRQLRLMREYRDVLDQRISAF